MKKSPNSSQGESPKRRCTIRDLPSCQLLSLHSRYSLKDSHRISSQDFFTGLIISIFQVVEHSDRSDAADGV
ncbi:hypothetical protein N658DRAFT_38152 [Parathielavia hyrcaniae]|uniref:Uncharacterized protein n=1 Tax=Parathielavia hyrcaniae TaxID=113614 RepID=A0AAN6T1X6_9PEZI|nr:hypothetical protein N658DRAFT_38152 [Parathielavia hyrcaniae]